jgi:hypothetical protein
VYKRPYVDFFLKKVSLVSLSSLTPGRIVVHTGHFHSVHARVRRPRHRLARQRARPVCQAAVPRELLPPA